VLLEEMETHKLYLLQLFTTIEFLQTTITSASENPGNMKRIHNFIILELPKF